MSRRPAQPTRPSNPNSQNNSSSSSFSGQRPPRPENPLPQAPQQFPVASPVTSPYQSQYASPVPHQQNQFPSTNSQDYSVLSSVSPQDAFRRQQQILQQQMNTSNQQQINSSNQQYFPHTTSQATIGQPSYAQATSPYYTQTQPQYQQQPQFQQYNYNAYPHNMQPQQSYFTPFPEPEHAPFYHLAPAHIQPLYISQFMFNPAIELVEREIPLNEAGNIIVDVQLSSQVIKDAKYADSKEFTHLRYTPLTCSPNDFSDKYVLKAKELKRDIKIAIVCTMYNEDEQLFAKSIGAVFDNIKAFCDYYRDPDWWKHIVVVIVSDGRSKINPRTLTALAAMGCYADGLIQTTVKDDPVTCHMFEYTPQLVVDTNGRILTAGHQKMCPVQTIFLLKEKNAKKINSHRWFFNAVCKQLEPEVCILLDVGTRPTKQSFLRLYRTFERNGNVGGACGEIAVELGKGCFKVLNPLVAAQNFEYKMSNILDKPLESVFGFISVLPGAFSAYRLKAIQGSPLDAYFKGESMHGKSNVSEANMYLAEDRILCFEIVAKRNASWVLKYVKNAYAETDVPDQLPELISQRRRWLNGSFFAALHSLMHWNKIYMSSHSLARKIMFTFQFLYSLINLSFTWFSVGNFYLAFSFLFDTSDTGLFGPAGIYISAAGKAIYLFLILVTVVSSLGNRPQGSKWLYMTIMVFFAFMMILMLVLSIYAVILETTTAINLAASSGLPFFNVAFSTPAFRDIVIALGATYGCYILSSIIYLDPWHCMTSMLWYILLLPSYVNILMIYAFCNIHDTTWGTKGDNTVVKPESTKITTNAEGKQVAELSLPSQKKTDVEEAYGVVLNQLKANALHTTPEKQSRSEDMKQEDYFRQYRTNTVLLWLLTNTALIYIFSSDLVLKAMFGGVLPSFNPYLTFLFWSVAGLAIIRFIFSTLYMILYVNGKVGDLGSRPRKSLASGVNA